MRSTYTWKRLEGRGAIGYLARAGWTGCMLFEEVGKVGKVEDGARAGKGVEGDPPHIS